MMAFTINTVISMKLVYSEINLIVVHPNSKIPMCLRFESKPIRKSTDDHSVWVFSTTDRPLSKFRLVSIVFNFEHFCNKIMSLN